MLPSAADMILEAEMFSASDSAVVAVDAWQTTQRSIMTVNGVNWVHNMPARSVLSMDWRL